jgi:hypothetical protein
MQEPVEEGSGDAVDERERGSRFRHCGTRVAYFTEDRNV